MKTRRILDIFCDDYKSTAALANHLKDSGFSTVIENPHSNCWLVSITDQENYGRELEQAEAVALAFLRRQAGEEHST